MWTFDKNQNKVSGIVTLARGHAAPADTALESELRTLVDDEELCAAMLADPELNELAELTRLAEQVRATFAPARRSVEPRADARVQRIYSAVLIGAGALPPEAALDEDAQDRAIEHKLAEYRRSTKRGLAKLFATRLRGRRDGPSVRER